MFVDCVTIGTVDDVTSVGLAGSEPYGLFECVPSDKQLKRMRTVSVNVLLSDQWLVGTLPCCITFVVVVGGVVVVVCVCFMLGVLNFANRLP